MSKGIANMHIRFSSAAIAATLLMTLTSAAGAKELCSVPKSEWQPKASLARKLEGKGWKIRVLKVDLGCYEVYGTDGAGKARETHFNPKTLQSVLEE